MARTLFELVGADPEIRFSPYCWRARMALLHKGIEADIRPWRFVERDALAFAGHDKVPVFVDGESVVVDSWAIALDLEQRYPDAPSLFRGEGAVGPTRFVAAWADTVMMPGISSLIVADIWRALDEECRPYFRESREKRFGRPLEQVVEGREQRVEGFRKSLQPIRVTLADRPFVGGDEPAHADYVLLGGFMWARSISRFELLSEDDPVWFWRERMLDLFDGYARNAKRVDA